MIFMRVSKFTKIARREPEMQRYFVNSSSSSISKSRKVNIANFTALGNRETLVSPILNGVRFTLIYVTSTQSNTLF